MKIAYYLGLHQIWTWSEECEIASEQIPLPRLTEIVGLLADCGELSEERDYKQYCVCQNRDKMQPPAVCDGCSLQMIKPYILSIEKEEERKKFPAWSLL